MFSRLSYISDATQPTSSLDFHIYIFDATLGWGGALGWGGVGWGGVGWGGVGWGGVGWGGVGQDVTVM